MSALDQFVTALLAVDRVHAAEILQASAARQGSLAALEALVAPALEQIGAAWEKGECALTQVYMSGRICEALADNHGEIPWQVSDEIFMTIADAVRRWGAYPLQFTGHDEA